MRLLYFILSIMKKMNQLTTANCTFEGNSARHVVGAIRLVGLTETTSVKNCKFTDNKANAGGSNVFVQWSNGLAGKLFNEWGNQYDKGIYFVKY